MKPKSCFVLWSGGIDSTYLILRLLNDGYEVLTGYCEIINNQVQAQAEQRAIALMANQIQHLFPRTFTHLGTIYRAQNLSTYRKGVSYRQVPYFLHALLFAPPTTYRALAYVAGDTSIKSLAKIKAAYDGYQNICYYKNPELIFPLKDARKPDIVEYLEKYYPAILDNCSWCAKPDPTTYRACGKCHSCDRMISDLSQLTKAA